MKSGSEARQASTDVALLFTGGISVPGPAHVSVWRCGWEAETLARTILVGDLNETPDDRSG